jgi:phosphate butyryltransferase
MKSEGKTLESIIHQAKGKAKRLAVAGGNAHTVIEAIGRAAKENVVEATLVGDRKGILEVAERHGVDPACFSIVDEPDVNKTAARAVELVSTGQADFLMKGLIDTAAYMKAILNRSSGLIAKGGTLTHVMVIEVPSYRKLLIVSDVAILVNPDLGQKILMLEACVKIARRLGVEQPKAGIISCVEKPSYKIDSTIDGKIMKSLAGRQQIEGAVVDGPLALDLALSKRCAEEKNFESPVAGDCDILIFPNICTANVFFKSLTILAGAKIAAVVAGARVPCVLTSRADTEESKYASIALGSLLA